MSETNTHLANVLSLLVDLHPDDQCNALKQALEFYNNANPDSKIEPHGGVRTRLVHSWPIDAHLGDEAYVVMDFVQYEGHGPPDSVWTNFDDAKARADQMAAQMTTSEFQSWDSIYVYKYEVGIPVTNTIMKAAEYSIDR